MTNKEKLIEMINNLNENGIELMLKCFNGINENEKYNINTSTERLEELQKIEEQKAEQEKAIHEAEKEKVSFKRSQAEHKRQKEFKAALTGKERRFFEVLECIKSTDWNRYCFGAWELMLLADTYDNNLIDGSLDIFRYGFMKGQRAEKTRAKRLNEKVRAC